MGLTAEEISALKLTDEELLTLGLTDEELLALRLQNEVYSMKNTSDGKASDDTEGDDIPSARASIIITMDDEQEGRTESALVTCYTYDSFNRLLRYSDHTGSTCYSYNADGYRTAKYDYSDLSDVTRYLTIRGRNLFETSCAGSFTALNTYGTTLTSRASLAGGYEYRNIVYLYNAYGDVVLVADAQTGMKLASYAYDPFGNAILARTPDTSVEISESSGESSDITVTSGTESSASIDNPYGYRGYVKDDESGLYYLNARYYDSTSGRFLTADTFRGSKDDPLSLNRYVYCQSNPVRYTDPSGHSIIGFIIAATITTFVYCTAADVVVYDASPTEAVTDGLEKAATVETVLVAPYVYGGISGINIIDAYIFGKSAGCTAVGGLSVAQGYSDVKNGIENECAEQVLVGLAEGVTGTGWLTYGYNTVLEGNEVYRNRSQTSKGFNEANSYDNSSSEYNFASEEKLIDHFEKHGSEFKGLYNSPYDYLDGAQSVIKNGYRVEYKYKGEMRTGYAQYMGNNSKGNSIFAFVGTNNDGFITTYHTESGKSFWKMLNGMNIPEISPK